MIQVLGCAAGHRLPLDPKEDGETLKTGNRRTRIPQLTVHLRMPPL